MLKHVPRYFVSKIDHRTKIICNLLEVRLCAQERKGTTAPLTLLRTHHSTFYCIIIKIKCKIVPKTSFMNGTKLSVFKNTRNDYNFGVVFARILLESLSVFFFSSKHSIFFFKSNYTFFLTHFFLFQWSYFWGENSLFF